VGEDELRAFYAGKGVEWVEVYMQSNQMNALQKPVAVQWLADQRKAAHQAAERQNRATFIMAQRAFYVGLASLVVSLISLFRG